MAGEECEGLEQDIRRGLWLTPHGLPICCSWPALLFPALLSPLTLPQRCSESLLTKWL